MLFLSYPGELRSVARALVRGLHKLGIELWCDISREALPPGTSWLEQIEQALERSYGYLVLLGPRPPIGYVRAEFNYAFRLHVQRRDEGHRFALIPLLLGGVEAGQLQGFIGNFQAVHLPDDVERAGPEELAGLAEALREALSENPSATHEASCPFPGLGFFKEDQSRFFFGRDAEIRALVERMGDTGGGHRRWIQIHGPSGAGKSSLARAGLVPAIRRGWITNASRSFHVVVVRPGRHPVRNLAQEVHGTLKDVLADARELDWLTRKLAGSDTELRSLVREATREDHRFLLVIDQLEEIFTLAQHDRHEADQFDRLVTNTLDDLDIPFHLVTTIRSDFLTRIHELSSLATKLDSMATDYYVKPMGATALESAIRGPAQLAGLSLAPGLANRLVRDFHGSVGTLPLVSHVLQTLWLKRSGNTLTHDAYDALEGPAKVLTQSADAIIKSMGDEGERAKRILLSLVSVERDRPATRRARPQGEIIKDTENGCVDGRILDRLLGGRNPDRPASDLEGTLRLVVSYNSGDEVLVDLIHDSLLEQWATLRQWVEDNRSALELRHDVETRAGYWKAQCYIDAALPSGDILAHFRHSDGHGDLAQKFLAAAEALEAQRLAERHRAEQQRLSRLRRTIAARIAIVILIGALGLFALEQRNQARKIADDERAARALLLAQQPGQEMEALKLGVAMVGSSLRAREPPIPKAIEALVSALGVIRSSLPVQHGQSSSVELAFSPDGARLASVHWGKQDRRSGTIYGGKRTTVLWDTATRRRVATLDGGCAAFSLDGKRLFTVTANLVSIWSTLTGSLESTASVPVLISPDDHWCPRLSPDGSRLIAQEEGVTALYELPGGKLVAYLEDASQHISFAPGGRIVAGSGDGATVRVWRADTGQTELVLDGSPGMLTNIDVTPDGRRVLASYSTNVVAVWDASAPNRPRLFDNPGRSRAYARFLPGGTLFSVHNATVLTTWDIESGIQLLRRGDETVPPKTSDNSQWQQSPDGSRIYMENGSSAQLVDAATGATTALRGSDGRYDLVQFSADGRILLASKDRTAFLWHAETGERLHVLNGHTSRLSDIQVFDASRIATVDFSGILRFWNPERGCALGWLGDSREGIKEDMYVGDGRLVVARGTYGTFWRWSASGTEVASFRLDEQEELLAISPDGSRLATYRFGEPGTRLVDATSGQLIAELTRAGDENNGKIFMSPDGKRVESTTRVAFNEREILFFFTWQDRATALRTRD